ncbi:MAG: DsbA family oxidoreductase [Solirubrobacteraceae bacterium]|jgi:predicted DsbA family dithiol-disulfide isomerase|nr:DsbA family oxidoreductase [Solirubrobacteraceae bacterium]
MHTPIPLDVFADLACPWCFIGHRRLAAALAGVPEGTFALRHRSFELQPQLPPEGMPMEAFVRARFGPDERIEERFAFVEAEGRRSGIAFGFASMPKAAHTRVAHRAVALAREQDFESQALDALYTAYFCEGLDITSADTVVACLAEAGLPEPGVLAAELPAGDGEEAVAEDEAIAIQIRVTAVPVVVAGRRIGFQGAQEPEVYARFLAQAPAQLAS